MSHTLFIGRWSPFHEGHKYIIDSYANNDQKVCVAVRDTPHTEKDPFPAKKRKELIERYYEGNENVEVIIIPDISQVAVGRGVGYSITEVPENIKKVSGTEERTLERKNWNDGFGHCFWLTGMPCSGKSTLANKLFYYLEGSASYGGWDCVLLDGDVFRKTFTPDLGFSLEDRKKNLMVAARTAKTLVDHGMIVIAAFVSPIDQVRLDVRNVIGKERFSTIHVDATVTTCEERDVKGMWAKARAGEIPDFTGVDSPYEIPSRASLTLDTTRPIQICESELKYYVNKVLEKRK